MGKPVPEYVTGDECLFCHRDIGPSWQTNRHHLTIREAESAPDALRALTDLAKDVQLVMGDSDRVRFLKRSAAYGKLDLLSVAYAPQGKKLMAMNKPRWDTKKFGDGCAGCHSTGVDSTKRTFSSVSLDCYACHGAVPLEHSKDTALAHLSKKRSDTPRVVISICASCHVRGGKSASTGLPYPNNFVAGDNLFRDFKVDFSPQRIARLNPADRHVLENVRDVVILGKEDMTCLSCHDVHMQSSNKHRLVAQSRYCLICHNATGPKKNRKAYEVHSETCGY